MTITRGVDNSTEKEHFALTVLGVRGSVPVHGPRFDTFGGATTCFFIEAGDQAVFVDAGTGIIEAQPSMYEERQVSVLITHPHLDHMAGLPFFKPLTEADRRIDIFAVMRDGQNTGEILSALFRRPYWPLMIEEYPADIRYHTLPYHALLNMRDLSLPVERPMLRLGECAVDGFEVCHPGGCTAYRLHYRGKTIVVATDTEVAACGPEEEEQLTAFLEGTDLLMADCQYTEEEYGRKEGYGHSTISQWLKIKDWCGVGDLVAVHHDPMHDDDFLTAMERETGRPDVHIARVGDRYGLI
ncbi:MAG: MBL fold metallo-hydrolase [Lachnospiraceae bacterium]|nr:MBL fold metallo-hydrolase [Lachnospiraceae bacterium]